MSFIPLFKDISPAPRPKALRTENIKKYVQWKQLTFQTPFTWTDKYKRNIFSWKKSILVITINEAPNEKNTNIFLLNH